VKLGGESTEANLLRREKSQLDAMEYHMNNHTANPERYVSDCANHSQINLLEIEKGGLGEKMAESHPSGAFPYHLRS